MSRSRKYISHAVLLLTMVTLVAVSLCCTAGYRLYTEDEGIAHFSFEYPSNMKDAEVYHPEKGNHVSVTMIRRVVENGWWDKDLYIIAQRPPVPNYEDADNVSMMFEKYLADIEDTYEITEVLESSTVNISGMQAEQVVYMYDEYSWYSWPTQIPPEGKPGGTSLVWIDRIIFLEHDGLVWFIRMKSTKETAEEARLDFEHILQTFTFLD